MLRLSVLAVCLLAPFPLSAQSVPPVVPLPQRLPQPSARQQLIQKQQALFRKLDVSADGRVSVDELLADVSAEQRTQQEHRLRICDFDGSEDLSFYEWRVHWAFGRPWDRDALPDFVSGSASRSITAMDAAMEQADPDQKGRFTLAEWTALKAPPEFPAWISLQPGTDWDLDSDESITREEVRTRLEMLYGVRTREGILLRDGGQMVHWRSLLRWDTNRDRKLSREEFVAGYWAEKSKSATIFDKTDRDADGLLTFAEVAKSGVISIDAVQRFAKWDQGAGVGAGDGQLSYEELRRNVSKWEQLHLRAYFNAADHNKTGRISLKEFLSSPWGMPLGDWFHVYEDTDQDLTLSWQEFLTQSCTPEMSPHDRMLVTGQARILFESLQADPDEVLTLQEFEYDLKEPVVSAESLGRILDLNDDGAVTFSEAFEFHGTIPPVPILSWFRDLYASADMNQDDQLSASELSGALHLQDVVAEWQRIGRPQWEQFQSIDFDGSGETSAAELIVVSGQERAPQLNRLLLMLDFDQSGGLNFEEFLCLPGRGTPVVRGRLPDPVQDLIPELLAQWQELLKPLDGDGDGRWTAEEWRHRTDFGLPGFLSQMMPPFDLGELDTNSDRSVTPEELQAGLELLLGVRSRIRGPVMRRPAGQRFSINRFATAFDAKVQGVPFAAMGNVSQLSGAKLLSWCSRVDRNANQALDLDELLQGDQFWHDPLPEFLRLDTDFNAQLSHDELTAAPKDWYQSYASAVIPAFDLDGSGSLSFYEYLGCPIGNPMGLHLDLVDASGDGQLQLQEFFEASDRLDEHLGLGQGYLAWVFGRWDLNGDQTLSLNERRFRLRLVEVSDELVFQYFDESADGQLSLEEAIRQTPPKGGIKSKGWEGYQKRSSRIEEAFLTADTNGDRQLSVPEFQSVPLLAVAMVPGRKATPLTRTVPASTVAPPHGGLSLRAWILIGFNALLLAGLGWLLLRR